jgi:hypothetical protein
VDGRVAHVQQVDDQQVGAHGGGQLRVADVVHRRHRRRDHLGGQDPPLAPADGGEHIGPAVAGQLAGRGVDQPLHHREAPLAGSCGASAPPVVASGAGSGAAGRDVVRTAGP